MLKAILIPDDLAVLTDEAREILSNPKDAEVFRQKAKELTESGQESITFTLSDNRELTLLR